MSWSTNPRECPYFLFSGDVTNRCLEILGALINDDTGWISVFVLKGNFEEEEPSLPKDEMYTDNFVDVTRWLQDNNFPFESYISDPIYRKSGAIFCHRFFRNYTLFKKNESMEYTYSLEEELLFFFNVAF